MEDLTTTQNQLGEEIQRVIRNYQKDPANRKTLAYYEKRLGQLETTWRSFDENDNTIREQFSDQLNHNYFTADYYNKIKGICEQFQDEFKGNIIALRVLEDKYQVEQFNPNEVGGIDLADPIAKQMEHEPRAELIKLVRLQQMQMNSLQHNIERIQSHKGSKTKEYYATKQRYIERLWEQIDTYNHDIWSITDNPEAANYDKEEYFSLEETYQKTIVSIEEELSKLQSIQTNYNAKPSEQPTSSLKLPTIEIPKFDGNYLKWRQFHDLFVQMVHSQPIGNCQKMWYLKANVNGEAERLIRHFKIADINYEAAWNTLKERYENKRLIVTTILNELMSQPALNSENPNSIKKLHDTTKECVMALENTNIDTSSWDPILTHIIIKKLDRATHTLFEHSLKAPRELQSLKELLKFLEIRFQSLEALGTKTKGESISAKALTLVSETRNCIECKGNHSLYSCPKFLQQEIQERFNIVKQLGVCYNCLKKGHSSKTCQSRGCGKCGKKHNTLIHFIKKGPSQEKATQSTERINQIEAKANSSRAVSCCANDRRSYVILGTVMVNVLNSNGAYVQARAVLDSGSQLNFISARLANKLKLEEKNELMHIEGIGSGKQKSQKRINIELHSRVMSYETRLEAFVLTKITANQPAHNIDIATWNLPATLELADPHFNSPSHIDLLIGAELYHDVMKEGQLKIGRNLPVMKNTVFGWMVVGKIESNVNQYHAVCGISTEEEIHNQLERFWKLEEMEEPSNKMCEADVKCETHFEQTVKRDAKGRFTVCLPFSDDPGKLGESQNLALKRFFAIERKLERDKDVRKQYVNFMREYEQLGHMTEIDPTQIKQPNYYLPHHFVLKPDSTTTKLRVVFDASAKTSSNISLNNILYKGPTLQEELFTQLLKFRIPRFAFTADIEKMYRQIDIHEKDRKFQLIWWRESSNQPVKTYQLNTVTYGTTSAPYLATKCLQRLAQEGQAKYPWGAEVLLNDFYMDDVMSGSDSMSTVMLIQSQLTELLKSGGFRLRKWSANHETLLQQFPPEDVEIDLNKTDQPEDKVKALGLVWKPKSDILEIKSNSNKVNQLTKRTAYSHIAQLFDPLGLMGPVVVTAKIFLQHLWTLKLDWDEPLNNELTLNWTKFVDALNRLNDIYFPRHIFGHNPVKNSQLHIFADASEKAYGAAAYIRTKTKDNRIQVNLLCAKSRVAPTKTQTLPRLELCAAKLAADLLVRIKSDLKYEGQTYLWSDSEIVLSWVHSPSKTFQTFVANRIASIQSHTLPEQWRHVPSKLNPADLLSRGIAPEKFKDAKLWFYGPIFLYSDEKAWPPIFTRKSEAVLERRKIKLTTLQASSTQSNNILNEINHRNSYQFLRRVMAYIFRFINVLKTKNKVKHHWLSNEELGTATQVIITTVQREEFKDDLHHLKKYNEVSKHSPLSGLDPFVDNKNMLRVGGRLQNAEISYEAKHPILLPYNHILSKLLMEDIHQRYLHVGPQGLLAITRQRYWIIKVKSMARSIVHHCIKCSRAKPRQFQQMMGSLPKHRIEPARPFINTGVDFCGPIMTHYKLRGKRPQKSYISVFCCFATKAVHMELVTDLSTDGFLGALKRFVGRRGYCKNIYSDNATNFVGACNKLKELVELTDIFQSRRSKEQIAKTCSEKNIEFHFIPPRAPHFGGLWEAAVKSAKHLLQRVLHSASLTYEELETVIIEAEAILNSRPLTPMSSNPKDFAALTPAHFLIGEPLTQSVDSECTPIRSGILARWKLVKHLQNEFWERWSKEYLCELQERHKWKKRSENIKPGQLVIIKEDNLPPLKWKLGRIVQAIKNKSDGLVRVAEVQTANGVVTRAVHRLAPLPIEENEDNKTSQLDTKGNEQPSLSQNVTVSHENKCNKPSGRKRRRSRDLSADQETPYKSTGMKPNLLTTILFTCCLLSVIPSNQAQLFKIQPFQSQSGIYFENLGMTHIVSNEWKLIVYYDTTLLWREYKLLLTGIETLKKLCSEPSIQPTCSVTIKQFEKLIEELNEENELLKDQKRIKRAPLNIVGNIASALFGILDADYAEKLSHTIDELQENRENIITLLQEQTSIIDSTVNIMKQDHIALKEALNHIVTLETSLDKLANEIHIANTIALTSTLSIQLILMAKNYERAQAALIDVLIDSYQGRVRPDLLSAQQLKTELTIIKEHLPENLRLPTTITELSKIYSLLKVEGRVTNKYIIFQLTLPLLALEPFELYHIVPVPINLNDTYITIRRSAPYLAVNLHRDQYYPLNELELTKCTIVEEDNRICKQQHPIYHEGATTSSCEIDTMRVGVISSKCEIISAIKNSEWIQLSKANTWIYSFKTKQVVTVVCDRNSSSTTLNGSGLLQMEGNCIIKQKHVTIRGHNILASNSRLSFTPAGSLIDVISPEKHAAWFKGIINMTQELEKFENLHSQLKSQKKASANLRYHDIHHYTMTYSSLALLVLVMLYLWYHRTRNLKMTPKPRERRFKVDIESHHQNPAD